MQNNFTETEPGDFFLVLNFVQTEQAQQWQSKFLAGLGPFLFGQYGEPKLFNGSAWMQAYEGSGKLFKRKDGSIEKLTKLEMSSKGLEVKNFEPVVSSCAFKFLLHLRRSNQILSFQAPGAFKNSTGMENFKVADILR